MLIYFAPQSVWLLREEKGNFGFYGFCGDIFIEPFKPHFLIFGYPSGALNFFSLGLFGGWENGAKSRKRNFQFCILLLFFR